MSRLSLLLISFILLLFGYPAFTQETSDPEEEDAFSMEDLLSMSLEDLLNIELETGSFLSLDLQNSSVSMTIITAEQIQSSGARHLSDALEIYVPGFQNLINKWNGFIWGMRGVASDRNTKFIFLVNGHKMNTESRDGAMTELDLGLLDDVERIEVLRGPAGLVYGSGAIAGVINIVTKEFEKETVTISSKLQTWNMETFGTEIQGSGAGQLTEDATIKIDIGYRESEGVGLERARLWGRPTWPYASWNGNGTPNGALSMGSAGSTPGNYKAAADFNYKNLRVYTRWTHQVTNGSGWFVLDPWPDIYGTPTEDSPSRMVDGAVQTSDSAYANYESWDNNRRQYLLNNVSTQATYNLPVGSNEILFRAGADALTNRIQFEDLKAYTRQAAEERNTKINETFGERRYNASATYLFTSREDIQFAAGYEYRYYDIGEDMSGMNALNGNPLHLVVSNVKYNYHSVFGEGIYNINDKFATHFGLRYDRHTRTAQHGGVLNPKIGLVFKPNDNHSVKLVYQQSANNGSADNYEFNRYSISDEGIPFEGDDYHFSDPTRPENILPPVNEELLKQLKPERSQSIELMTFHQIGKNIIALPSFSYNIISDLFAWNQTLFRVVNAGRYSFINIDLDLQYSSDKLSVGLNHTMQQLVGVDVANEAYTETQPQFDGGIMQIENGDTTYIPNPTGAIDTIHFNSVRDNITVDGKNFMSLNTHTSKVFVDIKPANWVTLHTSARVFWGLKGRTDLHEFDPETHEAAIADGTASETQLILDDIKGNISNATEFEYFDIHKTAIVKMNAGVTFKRPESPLTVSFHVYDLLAGNGSEANKNSIRWMPAFSPDALDLFGVDLRSYAFKLTYQF